MKTYIALLRGINVGGRNVLRMEDLKTLLVDLNLQNVKTYIQSGNVAFESGAEDISRISEQISAEIKARHGFEPHVLVMALSEMKAAMAANPFPEAEHQPKTLHLTFLASEPKNLDLSEIEAVKKYSERYRLLGKVFYLYAPDGIGRSKLMANLERLLGVPTTSRNWRTVEKIVQMAEAS